MGKLIVLKINNSRKAAIIKGKWKDPGAKLYDQLLDAMYCKGDIPTNPKDLEAAIKSGDYCDWPGFLKEAYAVAPVKDIKNSPYGRTPFSRSGCKYPHHVIKNGQLVVSIPGLRSAYICARNQGVLVNHTPENKQIVAHLNKHFRELSIEPVWHHGELYFQDTKTKKFTERFDFDGVDTVIFDIGSVLSEPKGGKELIKKKYHNKFNETQLDCFVKSYYDKLEDYETASIFNAKKLYQSFLTDDIKQYSDDIFEILALSGDAYDYTDYMIKELKNKGYKLYYLSNWHKSGFELMKQKGKFKYLDQFDGGLVSYDVGCQKPDPKIYQLLIDRFKLNPHTCIFFDDREENIEAAKKIGFKAEQFHRDTVKEINTMKRDNVYNERIAENFHFIQQHIFESMRINLFDESDYFKVLKSNVDENFKPKGTKSLSDFTMMKITKELTKKFADQGKLISYMRDDDPKYDDECLLWVDDQGNYVCSITYDKVPNKDDGHKWISGMDVAYAYNGYGLSHQLLDYAIDHGVDALSVQMDNEIALKTYKSHGFEISQESQSKVDNGLSSQYDMFLSTNQSSNESFNESVMSNEAIVLNSGTQNEIGHTPEEIYEWMHKNISYDKTITGWKLKLPSEVYVEKKGNCHDQALFEAFMFHSLGIINGQIFFVEFSKDNPIGGNSHTLTWFRTAAKEAKLSDDWKAPFKEENRAKGPFKFWWFENAWEDQSGIHGPYGSVNEIKDAVLEVYNNDNDINSHKYDGIVFATNSNYRCGMSLGEYVESWRLDDDRLFDKDQAIKEGLDNIENIVIHGFGESNHVNVITKLSRLLKNIKTPKELSEWMKCIQYGWIDKQGNINGTGDNDETQHLFDEYRLQSPRSLIKTKVGVCWDQVEFERMWFEAHNYPYAVIYVEVDDGDNNPTHTFLIYKNPGESNEVYWFENSWYEYRGIHPYSDLKSCLNDAISKVLSSFNTDGIKIIRKIRKAMPYKISCEEYYNKARNGFTIDLNDIQYDDIFNESTMSWLCTPSKELMEKYAAMSHLDMMKQSWRTEILCERIIPQGKVFTEAEIDAPPELDTEEEKDVLDEEIDTPPELDSNIGDEQSESNTKITDTEGEDKKDAGTDTPGDNDQNNEVDNETSNKEEVKEEKPEPKKESLPKQADRAESDKNGVRRKKLYIAFIEWSKEYNSRNTFGSIFDKDAFHDSYPFVPHEMRYFYRLANPMLCVLAGDLTFFQVAELRKLNANNKHLDEMLIFAATPKDLRVFNIKDKKVYRAEDSNGEIQLKEVLSDTFDTYIQMMIQKGDILNGPIEDESKKDE